MGVQHCFGGVLHDRGTALQQWRHGQVEGDLGFGRAA